MTVRIVVACGSGAATSQTVASKVRYLLAECGYSPEDVQGEAVPITELRSALRGADAYISVVSTETPSRTMPVFNGVAFLTGIGQAEEFSQLRAFVERRLNNRW